MSAFSDDERIEVGEEVETYSTPTTTTTIDVPTSPESVNLLIVEESSLQNSKGTFKKSTENLAISPASTPKGSVANKDDNQSSKKLLKSAGDDGIFSDDEEKVIGVTGSNKIDGNGWSSDDKAKYGVDNDTENYKKGSNGTNNNNNQLPNNLVLPQKPGKEQTGAKRFLGIILALAAALQFSLSALIIKILGYHPFNLGVWRFGVMSIIPIPFLAHAVLIKKQSILQEKICSSTTVFLMLQAILGANSIIFVFFGLKYLNIADSIVIGTSAPVFVTLFAYIFLGERCGIFAVVTAFLALVGVGIISKPPILTGASALNEDNLLGVISSFSSMILLTICYVVIRYLREVHHALVNLCFGVWGLFQSIIMAYCLNVLEVPKDYFEVGLIIISAFLAFFAQTCITLALKFENAGPVALVRTMEVVFAFAWQALFLGVEADMYSVLGAAVTLSGVVLTALRKMVMSLPEDDKYRKRFGFLLL